MNSAIDLLSAKQPQAIETAPKPGFDSAPEQSPLAANDTGSGTVTTLHASGLVTGKAPAPDTELPLEPEPQIADVAEGESRFRKLLLTSAVNDNVTRYIDGDVETGEVTVSLVDKDRFIEFWAVDAWETLSSLGSLIRIDLSSIETEPDEVEQGKKAAECLYGLAHKYPRLLGWMLHEKTINGGDFMIVGAFYGGKLMMALAALQQHRANKQETKS